MYCKEGEKPTIIYKFNNGQERRYECPKSPINIEIKEGTLETFTGGQCPQWYGIITEVIRTNGTRYIEHSAPGVGFLGPLTFIRRENRPWRPGGDNAWMFDVGCRGSDDLAYFVNGVGTQRGIYAIYGEERFIGFERYNPGGGNASLLDNCGDPIKQCDLIVTHNGDTIFTDRGNCPITFEVQCGDCPEGQERVETSGYPGYCCLDCASIKSDIRSIKSILASKLNS